MKPRAPRIRENMFETGLNRHIVQSSADCIKVLDTEGRLLFMNTQGQRLLSIKEPENIYHSKWVDFWTGEDRAKAEKALQTARRGEEGRFDGFRPTMDGTPKWWNVLVSPMLDSRGRLENFLCISRDITAQKEVERESDYRKRLLEGMSETIPDAILIVSPDGKLSYFNQRFVEMWNFPPRILRSGSDAEALRWASTQVKNPAQFMKGVTCAYQNPSQEVREELAFKNGRIYDRHGAPVPGRDGKSFGWVWCFRDITDRKATERAILRARKRVAKHAESLAEGVAERTRELTLKNEELRNLSRKVVHTQESERRKLAAELHDNIGQQLTTLKLLLEQEVIEQGKNPRLRRAQALAADLLERTRGLSMCLRDSLPDHLTLPVALRWRLETFSRTTKIRGKFSATPLLQKLKLGPEIKATFFQIAQEALTNVMRHSKAKEVLLDLRATKQDLVLRITDDGIGFDPMQCNTDTCVGLSGIRDRARAVGGEFALRTAPGKGVRITATAPITPLAAA